MNNATKALAGDLLFETLKEGTATEDDQRAAAKWIMWLCQFVPDDAYAQRAEGVNLSQNQKRSLNHG